jgi:alpha-beta hydrolase superfamily lysophospholipase
VLIVALLLGAGYLGAGAIGWTRLTEVVACKWSQTTPADFPGQWRADASLVIDSTPYQYADFSDVVIDSTTPGLELRGWWSPPTMPDHGAVLIVHGRNACRGDPQVLVPAGMLHHAGFGVLLIDLRDNGQSDREDGHWAGGVDEWQDVDGAWRWLQSQGFDADEIGLMGVSMGTGAISLAMAREPAMAAAFLDSPWADLSSEAAFLAGTQGLPGWIVPGVLAMGQLISGDELLGLSPERGFRESLAGRPVVIVHGESDRIIDVEQGKRLAEAARESGSPVDLWLLPGVEHVQAVFVATAEYQDRLLTFFTQRLATPG